MFLDALLYDATQGSKSCNQMAIETGKKYKVNISRQGIDQRFSVGGLDFIKALIQDVLSQQLLQSIDIGWLKNFNRVLIKDSTKFNVDTRVKEKLPGFGGGGTSEAGVSIQYEFDIKTGEVRDFAITPANRTDSKDVMKSVELIEEGDLTIRDLGYFSTAYFIKVQKKKAFFLSRLHTSINVYIKENEEFKEINFGKLYHDLVEGNRKLLDIEVFIGKKDKFPCRLIMELVPDAVFEKRMKNINSYNKRKGHQTTDEYRSRSRFNLFITNIPEVSGCAITKIYKIRWQVELVFKTWKSTFELNKILPMKYERLICTLSVRLLIIFINWTEVQRQRVYIYEKYGRLLSINKCFKSLKVEGIELRKILTKQGRGIELWMRHVALLFETHHWLEKKKNKLGLIEIMALNDL